MDVTPLVTDVDGRLVTPEVGRLFEKMRRHPIVPYDQLGVAAARDAVEASVRAQGEPQGVHSVIDFHVTGRAGAIPVRLYLPVENPTALIVYLHGGGWVTGSVTSSDPFCRSVANSTRLAVASVEYRRAPESRFPGPLNDAIDAVAALAALRAQRGFDLDRLVLVGDSAGAHLAASVVQRGESKVTDLALFYPAVHPPRAREGSWVENDGDPILPARTMNWFWEQYGGSLPLADPRFSLLEGDLHGFPRTLVATCGLDVLRDEGRALALALSSQGVDVHELRYPGMIHGFFSLAKHLPQAAEAGRDLVRWLSRAHQIGVSAPA